jgi:hypothetical protein
VKQFKVGKLYRHKMRRTHPELRINGCVIKRNQTNSSWHGSILTIADVTENVEAMMLVDIRPFGKSLSNSLIFLAGDRFISFNEKEIEECDSATCI